MVGLGDVAIIPKYILVLIYPNNVLKLKTRKRSGVSDGNDAMSRESGNLIVRKCHNNVTVTMKIRSVVVMLKLIITGFMTVRPKAGLWFHLLILYEVYNFNPLTFSLSSFTTSIYIFSGPHILIEFLFRSSESHRI